MAWLINIHLDSLSYDFSVQVAKSIIDIISKNLSEDGIFLPEEDTGNYVIEGNSVGRK